MIGKDARAVGEFGLLRIEREFGIAQHELGEGTCRASQWLPAGLTDVSVAWLGPLIDFAIGRAAETVLPVGVDMRTASVHVEVVKRCDSPIARVFAEGEVVGIDRATVLGSARISTDSGLPIVRATARNILVEGTKSPQQWVDPAPGPPATPDMLDFLRGSVASSGSIEVPAHQWLANPYGIVHGGVLVTLLQLGVEAAVRGHSAQTLDLGVSLHRPAVVGGEPIVVTGTVERLGRRVIVTSSSLYQRDPDKPIATARATMMRT